MLDNTFLRKVSSTYTIYIGLPEHGDYKGNVYKIINTNTGVVEAEVTIYAKAVYYAKQFDEMLVEQEKEELDKQFTFETNNYTN